MAINVISAVVIENEVTPCTYVDILVTVDAPIYGWFFSGSPITLTGALTSFLVSVPREFPGRVALIETEGSGKYDLAFEDFGILYFHFRHLYSSNINIITNPNLDGTHTVDIALLWHQEPNLPYNSIDYEYSLNDVDWFDSSNFPTVATGSHIAYVRDSMGCKVQKSFELEAGVSNPFEKFFFISNVNSVTFAKDEVWDSLQDGIYKTRDNTLSLTGIEDWLNREAILYRDKDNIKIQFKSNYPEHEITIEDCKGELIELPIVALKKSENLDLFESLDCHLYAFNSNILGMYFSSGDYYDEVGSVLGQFELQGNLPNSAIIGTVMEIPGYGSQEVVDIFYDRTINKRVCIFNVAPSTLGVVIMKALYNLLPYNIYEFPLDFGDVTVPVGLMNQIRIRIKAFDIPNAEEENHYSEYINILSDGDWADMNGDNDIVSFDYFNKNNQDIFYIYGITHFFRTAIKMLEEVIIDDSEITIGDKTTNLIKSSVNEGIKIEFEEVNYREMIKITLALSSEVLFINGKGYVKNEGIEVKKIENTNLFNIECTLIDSGESFNININGATGGTGNPIYIPKLIETGTGNYLKT